MTDDEINRQVAERVMGIHVHPVTANHFPDYCNSWAAMGEVIEKVGHGWAIEYDEDGWNVAFVNKGREGSAFADTAPMAVCLAALKACGVK